MSPPPAADVKTPPRRRDPPSPEAERIARGLRDSIRSHTPNFVGPSSLDGWARDIDLALRLDSRTVEDVEDVVRWCHGDPRGEFWKTNILSGKTLRRQMDQLLVKMRASDAPHANGNGKPGGGMTVRQILQYAKEKPQ